MATKHDLPEFAQYFPCVLQTLKERGGSASIEEIEDGVAKAMGLSDEVLAAPHGDGPRTQFQYELAWVRTYLKKVGAVDNSERGIWSLTESGEGLSNVDALLVPQKVRAETKNKRKDASERSEGDEAGIEEVSREPDQSSWIDTLLSIIGRMQPAAFERLAQRLLRESGFIKVDVTGRSGDGGIDGIGVLRMNLVSFQVLFQCKRWKGSVGAPEVRDFRGAMIGRADKGLIITTGTFTADARREATRDGAPAIDLIDGELLCSLLKERKLGVQVEMVERISVSETFFQTV